MLECMRGGVDGCIGAMVHGWGCGAWVGAWVRGRRGCVGAWGRG